jgi:prolyl oligopeptidase
MSGNTSSSIEANSFENIEDAAVQSWLTEQQALCQKYFDAIPGRTQVKDRLTTLMQYPKIGIPWVRGEHIYYFFSDGKRNQSVVCRRKIGSEQEEVILDPNQFSKSGTVSVTGIRLSKDCKYLAYGLSKSGSDWQEWRIRSLQTLEDLPEVLTNIRGSIASWLKDGSGFFYTLTANESEVRSESQGAHQSIMFHRIGTLQIQDVEIFRCPIGKSWSLIGKVSEDGAYLLIFAYESANDQNRIWIKSINDLEGEARPVIEDFKNYYIFFASIGPKLWFRTNFESDRGQILEIDVSDPNEIHRRTIVTQDDATIERASIVGERLLVVYLKDASSCVKIFDLEANFIAEANVPKFGNLTGFDGLRKQDSCFFGFSSFNTPQTIFKFYPQTNSFEMFWKNQLPFSPDDFVTRQVFVESYDGIKVPMFISHLKSLDLNKSHPTYLYSYGGFGFCHKPFYSTAHLHWMEMGGIFCLANVRGGGEYGQAWHDDGRLSKKRNSFFDFNACAAWLIESGMTTADKLAAGGRSNGGLTVTASAMQRPEYYRAVITAVGVLDLLRFHLLTVGWTWKAEYGDPDNSADRDYILKYSPLHNVEIDRRYPAFLISTADHDDRVHPSHSFKFAYALQNRNLVHSTKILRLESQMGHGAGKPLAGYIEEVSDFLSFLAHELSLPGF